MNVGVSVRRLFVSGAVQWPHHPQELTLRPVTDHLVVRTEAQNPSCSTTGVVANFRRSSRAASRTTATAIMTS